MRASALTPICASSLAPATPTSFLVGVVDGSDCRRAGPLQLTMCEHVSIDRLTRTALMTDKNPWSAAVQGSVVEFVETLAATHAA